MDTATALKELRKGMGLTQVQFAQLVGVRQATVSRSEAGKPVSGNYLTRVAKATGKTLTLSFT